MNNTLSVYLLTRLGERQLAAQKRLTDTVPNGIERWRKYRPMWFIPDRYNTASRSNPVLGASKRMGRIK